MNQDGKRKSNITIGCKVEIVEKHNQASGKLTVGNVSKILTNSSTHPHGIKVKLDNGKIGRVKNVLTTNKVY